MRQILKTSPSLIQVLHKRTPISTGFVVCLLFVLIFIIGCSHAVTVEKNADPTISDSKEAILLVAFGISNDEKLPAYKNVERLVRERLPDAEIHWAYTSHIIRKKLAQKGIVVSSPEEAVNKLISQGVTRLTVQSLHVIPGHEYDEMLAVLRHYQPEFESLSIGPPLLSSVSDAEQVIDILLKNIPERGADDALIFMGHGTSHSSGFCYVAVNAMLNEKDSRAYLGTVAGHPTFDQILSSCRKSGVQKAVLVPFMVVSGDHARNDMGGDDPDSWKSMFAAEGIDARPVYRGMTEVNDLAGLFVDHLIAARSVNAAQLGKDTRK
ncbi:MAG: sirohydrochlorin cobaltochelatase [Desulfobacteraceae bacterium]|jgi:sirohydrochlorin cobaltochelatase|nr:sirohydrochlorin cobaltochelatase [Desulfobacteraceae bacterium]